ncbi:DNA methyltransferase [Methylobacter svalbardensis]
MDTFVGSGSTAIACRELGRGFVGCEMGEVEFEGAVERLEK